MAKDICIIIKMPHTIIEQHGLLRIWIYGYSAHISGYKQTGCNTHINPSWTAQHIYKEMSV